MAPNEKITFATEQFNRENPEETSTLAKDHANGPSKSRRVRFTNMPPEIKIFDSMMAAKNSISSLKKQSQVLLSSAPEMLIHEPRYNRSCQRLDDGTAQGLSRSPSHTRSHRRDQSVRVVFDPFGERQRIDTLGSGNNQGVLFLEDVQQELQGMKLFAMLTKDEEQTTPFPKTYTQKRRGAIVRHASNKRQRQNSWSPYSRNEKVARTAYREAKYRSATFRP